MLLLGVIPMPARFTWAAQLLLTTLCSPESSFPGMCGKDDPTYCMTQQAVQLFILAGLGLYGCTTRSGQVPSVSALLARIFWGSTSCGPSIHVRARGRVMTRRCARCAVWRHAVQATWRVWRPGCCTFTVWHQVSDGLVDGMRGPLLHCPLLKCSHATVEGSSVITHDFAHAHQFYEPECLPSSCPPTLQWCVRCQQCCAVGSQPAAQRPRLPLTSTARAPQGAAPWHRRAASEEGCGGGCGQGGRGGP